MTLRRRLGAGPKSELITDAARRMRMSHFGDPVVVDDCGDHVPIGTVTDRDIVISVVAGRI